MNEWFHETEEENEFSKENTLIIKELILYVKE